MIKISSESWELGNEGLFNIEIMESYVDIDKKVENKFIIIIIIFYLSLFK